MDQLNENLISALITLLTAAITSLAAIGTAWIYEKRREVIGRIGQDKYDTAMFILESLAKAAEQLGLKGELQNIGKEKKAWVLKQAQGLFTKFGIKLTADQAASLLEAVIRDGIHKGTPQFIEVKALSNPE